MLSGSGPKIVLLLALLALPACRILDQMSSSSFHYDASSAGVTHPEAGSIDLSGLPGEADSFDGDGPGPEALPGWSDDGRALDAPEESDQPGQEGAQDGGSGSPDLPGLSHDAGESVSADGRGQTSTDSAVSLTVDAPVAYDTAGFLEMDARSDAQEVFPQTTTTTSTSLLTGTQSSTGFPTSAPSTATTTGSGSASVVRTGTGTGTGVSTGSQVATATQSATTTTTGTGSGTGSALSTGSSTSSNSSGATATASASAQTGTASSTTTASGLAIPVSGVAVSKTSDALAVGRTDQLAAIIVPANASNRAVIWSSSNPNIAAVSNQGLVTAVGKGTASITVTTVDGGKTDSCTVTVSVPVAGVSLSLSTATIGTGGTLSLTATIVPADANDKAVTWSTSNAGIVSLQSNGTSAIVTGLGAGTTTVTATTHDGAQTATCIVTVASSAQWVQTPLVAPSSSTFSGLAVDGLGNIYVVGFISGAGLYSFGNSVQATGASAGSNLILLKYAADGSAQWARTIAPAPGSSAFSGVAVDSGGNIYAVGTLSGTGSYDFGNSIVASPSYAFGSNLLIVKYDATGTAQWARTVIDGFGSTSLASVAVDGSGNVYAVGMLSDASMYDLGNGVVATGVASSGKNALLVKYRNDGRTLWAQSPHSGSSESALASVAIGPGGEVFAVGYLAGTLTYDFGNSVTTKGPASLNALLVRYNGDGLAQWARAPVSGVENSTYNAVVVNSQGQVYVAGGIYGTSANDFGGNVKVTGATTTGNSLLLLKYASNGTAQWGESLVHATGLSRLSSIALDAAEHVYGAGLLAGPGSYNFGNQITAEATSNGNEILLAKYDASGACERAQTAATGSSISGFLAVKAAPNGSVFVAGYVNGTSPVDFGNSLTVSGAYSGGYNAVLVKYR
jgi:uncharacterized protein YjdB